MTKLIMLLFFFKNLFFCDKKTISFFLLSHLIVSLFKERKKEIPTTYKNNKTKKDSETKIFIIDPKTKETQTKTPINQ